MLAGCNRAPENKDAIRQAVIEHLQKNAGLDPNQMQIEIASVSFGKNEARATVSFKPKGQPANEGLEMNYTLESKDGKWTVKGRGQSSGMPHATPSGGMPGGAPGGMPGGMPGAGGQGGALPPGHPAIPLPEGDSGKSPQAPPKTQEPGKK